MRKSARNCIDKLNSNISIYTHSFDSKLSSEIVRELDILFDYINTSNPKKQFDVDKVNEMLYNDPIIHHLLVLMGKCEQIVLNSISGLLQATILRFPDDSLPDYFKKHPNDLNIFFNYFNQIEISSTAHIIFRACIYRSRDFTKFILRKGYIISFFQYLVDDNFDLVGPAFASYNSILNTYIDLSSEYVAANWNTFNLQFKLILHSENYIILSYFLGVFYKFLSASECKINMQKFIDDPENLIIILKLLKSSKRRLSVGAYNMLKLFAMNARRSKFTFTVFKENKKLLLKILENFIVPDVPSIQEQLDDEHEQLISIIKNVK